MKIYRLLLLMLLDVYFFASEFIPRFPSVRQARKGIALLCLWLTVASADGFAQTHVFPATDTNNSFTGSNTFKYLENCRNVDGSVGSFVTLAAALTDVGASNLPICITSSVTLTGNTTVPSNVELVFWQGGQIVSGGFTLAINGPISALPTQKLFSGFTAGQVTVSGLAPDVSVDWWGAINDGSFVTNGCAGATANCYKGTDNWLPILSAVKALAPTTGNVWFPRTLTNFLLPQSGIYMMGSAADCAAGTSSSAAIASLIQVPNGIHFRGKGMFATVVMQEPSSNCVMFINAGGTVTGNWGSGFHGLRIDGNGIYDGTHNDNVFHPSNSNSTNSSACGIYWNGAPAASSEAPSLQLEDVYISGQQGMAQCSNNALLVYGSGPLTAHNVHIAYNQFARGFELQNSDSTIIDFYTVADGGWGGFEGGKLTCAADNRIKGLYLGGGDGGSSQFLLVGAQNNKIENFTDDLACGIDTKLTDGGAGLCQAGVQPSQFNDFENGQISRAGGGCGTQALGFSFEGGAFGNKVNNTLWIGNGGAVRPWQELNTAHNNMVKNGIFSGWGNVVPAPLANSGTTYDLGPAAPTVSSGFGTSPSIVNSNSYDSFSVNVGTGGTATNGVVGLPSAVNGWSCTCEDITTTSATVNRCKQTASTASSATLGNFNTTPAAAAWVASDILSVQCKPR